MTPLTRPLAPLSVCLFELFLKIDIFVKRDPASLSCHLGNCNLGDNHLRGLAPTICHLRLQHLANGLGLQPETILWVFPTDDRLLIFRLIVKNSFLFSPPYTFSTLFKRRTASHVITAILSHGGSMLIMLGSLSTTTSRVWLW